MQVEDREGGSERATANEKLERPHHSLPLELQLTAFREPSISTACIKNKKKYDRQRYMPAPLRAIS